MGGVGVRDEGVGGVGVGRVEGTGVGGEGVGEDSISASKMSYFPLKILCIFWSISFLEPAWIDYDDFVIL